MEPWISEEIEASALPDPRLRRRLGVILQRLSEKMGQPLPAACRDWAATKAAYRFFDNPRVDEQAILAGHFAATRARVTEHLGEQADEAAEPVATPVLVLHDTTELSYQRQRPEQIGVRGRHPVTPASRSEPRSGGVGGQFIGRPTMHTTCGMLVHSSLAVTLDGVPLGLAAVKLWTRRKFKGTNALSNKVNPTRIPIEQKESMRWVANLEQSTHLLGHPQQLVHVGDREADLFELFCQASHRGTHFLVRTCVDRRSGRDTGKGKSTIDRRMRCRPILGVHTVQFVGRDGKHQRARLKIKARRMRIRPPIGKEKRYPSQVLTVIHAREINPPSHRKPIVWKLLTDLPTDGLAGATRMLDWYALRWKIETYHKVLKSGCQVEAARLQTAERLSNLVAVCMVLGWRVFWLTMVGRIDPQGPPQQVFTETQLLLLNQLDDQPHGGHQTISRYLYAVARLGGYLDRSHDPPPGNMVLWRGLSRLTDIQLGFELRQRLVGN